MHDLYYKYLWCLFLSVINKIKELSQKINADVFEIEVKSLGVYRSGNHTFKGKLARIIDFEFSCVFVNKPEGFI